jgi:hypothetical protein
VNVLSSFPPTPGALASPRILCPSAVSKESMGKRMSVPEGCEFPQLREVLDPGAFSRALHRGWGLAGSGVEIESCAVDDFHYKPGGGCRLVFRVGLKESGGGVRDEQWVIGRIPGAPQAPETEQLMPSRWGPAFVRIAEWDLDLWTYPNDPELPGLARLLDVEWVRARLAADPARYGLDSAPVSVTGRLGKHVVGKRGGVRLRVRTERGAEVTLFGKAYRRDPGRTAYTRLDQVWNSRPRREGAFLAPRALAWDEELGLFWQEALAGAPLNKDPETLARLPEFTEDVGHRLAGLHRANLDLPLELGFDTQLAWVQRARRSLEETYPEGVAACAPAFDALLTAAPAVATAEVAVLHGSFRMSHALPTPRGIGFIDFDGACLGDPAVDLGRWIAHAYRVAIGGKVDVAAVDLSTERLCAGYAAAAARPVVRERIRWSAACNLLAGAMDKSVKRMDPRALEALAKLAEGLCPR